MSVESMARRLDHLTWAEARDAAASGAGVLLAVTSTEQLGPHLPLGTDAITGQALALAVAETLDLIVAPPLTYGYRSRPLSGGGQRFPGTISLRGATLIAVLTDIINELRRSGFRRIVLLAHHMENQNFVYEAAYEAVGPTPSDGTRVVVIESPYPEFSADLAADLYGASGPPPIGLDHAAIVETSLIMHLRPDLVRTGLIADDSPPRPLGYDVLPIPDGFTAETGVLSAVEGASAALGARCFGEITAYLCEIISDALLIDPGPSAVAVSSNGNDAAG
jgi:creatinine amidohydrolase